MIEEKADSGIPLVLKIKCAKFHQDRNNIKDLYRRTINIQKRYFIYRLYIMDETPPSEPQGEILGSKDSEEYAMNYGKIGLCYIFNHKSFDSSRLEERSGTDFDAEQLEELFGKLGFVVSRFDNYEFHHIAYKLQEVSGEESKIYSCFVCCILSYGNAEGKLWAFDQAYPIQRIYERFYADKCTFMAGKPKIFFIQACPCNEIKSIQQSTDSETQVTFKIPTNADFLVVYSTVPGCYSWKNSITGSWFIDALCSTVHKYVKNTDLLQLLSTVNYEVSMKYKNYKSEKLKVEVPCVTSTLTRDIKFPVDHFFESKLQERHADLSSEMERLGIRKLGKVLIFNHKSYENDPNNKYFRKGTQQDAKNLQEIFERLHFDVDIYTDKERNFILKELNTVANGPNEKYSYLFCCILTHGNYESLRARDGLYKIEDVFSPFYNNWIGIPKIFFIQACQGEKFNCGFKMAESQGNSIDLEGKTFRHSTPAASRTIFSTESEKIFNFRHLTQPDFLIVSSAAPGYFSFRNQTLGSWFVDGLLNSFNLHKDKSFLQLLTITNRQVAIERMSCNDKNEEKSKKKQTLCLTSTLTQNIDFDYIKQVNF